MWARRFIWLAAFAGLAARQGLSPGARPRGSLLSRGTPRRDRRGADCKREESIDFASYALTDPIVIEALNGAERRGVVIRVVLDPREPHDFVKLGDLSDMRGSSAAGPFMHLKAYAIDGTFWRTGSANFSTSGENAQDNDLSRIRDPAPRRNSKRTSSACGRAQPMIEFEPANKALEPK